MRKIAGLVLIICILAAGCSGMSYTAQRTVTGGALGAASGAAIGAIAGNAGAGAAIGGGAGLLGGYAFDQYKKSRGEP